MSKCRFNVGDIIVGNNKHSNAICEVVETNDCLEDNLQIKIIYHTEMEKPGSAVYSVQDKYFDLVIPAKKKNVKEMTVAEIEKELGHGIKVVGEDGAEYSF